MASRAWRFSTAPYCDFDLVVDTGRGIVLLKEWFDPGKDPMVSRYSLDEFDESLIPSHPGRQQLIHDIRAFMKSNGR